MGHTETAWECVACIHLALDRSGEGLLLIQHLRTPQKLGHLVIMS